MLFSRESVTMRLYIPNDNHARAAADIRQQSPSSSRNQPEEEVVQPFEEMRSRWKDKVLAKQQMLDNNTKATSS
jgi:hypothetical protein